LAIHGMAGMGTERNDSFGNAKGDNLPFQPIDVSVSNAPSQESLVNYFSSPGTSFFARRRIALSIS
jgi:hypothetical protein